MAKKKEATKEVVNPFEKGVTYEVFLKALGNEKVGTYLKDICTNEQINYIENELNLYNNLKTKK